MHTKIQKWGNSLGVRIPKAFADEACVSEGAVVDVSVIDGNIVLQPLPQRYALEDLLAEVNADNIHAEVDAGDPVGKEIW